MKPILENWKNFVQQQVEDFLPDAEVRSVNMIGSSALSPEERAAQDLEKYGHVRDDSERDIDIEVQVAGVSNEDVEAWAFSEEAEELEATHNYDVQLRIVENWRGFLKEEEESYYHGGGKDFLPTRIGTFYSKDKAYAEKYAKQHKDGEVVEVEIDLSQANIYPQVFWWKEFQELWQPQETFKEYDIVKVIEPNGEEPSIVVLNPKLVRVKE